MNKVLTFYGEAGKDNGVTVNVGAEKDASGKSVAEGGTHTLQGRTTITLDIKQMNSDYSNRNDGSSVDTEKAAAVAHEGQHGVQQQANGMPGSKAEVHAGEEDAFKVQSYVNQGLRDNSAYGIWTTNGGLNQSSIDRYSDIATKVWCDNRGGCN